MYFLSFETSTKIFSLALNKDEKVLRYRNLKSAFLLENSILPAVDKILESAAIKFSQIDGFAIALGPGSFTSLRVGLSTVKAFAMATGKPVVGIPSLDIIARGIKGSKAFNGSDQICVLNNARRGKVYACFYGPHGREGDYLLTSIDEVLAQARGKALLVRDAQPQIKVMAAMAYERFRNKEYDDPAKLLPLYLYPQDCQVAIPHAA